MTLEEPSESRLSKMLSNRTIPVDLLGVCLGVGVIAVVYYMVASTALRFLAAVPLLLFLPGYVVVGVLFPKTGRQHEGSRLGGERSLAAARNLDRVTVPERLALSFGLSVAIVPFFGFALELLPVAAFDGAIFPTLVAFVLLGAVAAAIKRLRTPADERFRVPIAALGTSLAAPFTRPMDVRERIVTIALAVSILLAVVSVGYALAAPQTGEQYTELRVMTESPDGELLLGNYPDDVETGDEMDLVVGIDNRESTSQEYTVVVTADQLIADDTGVTPIESTEIDRLETTLSDGERLHQPQAVTFGTTGQFRLSYYLYLDDPPADPDSESAYRHLHFTVTAVDGGEPIDGSGDVESIIDSGDATVEPVDHQPPAVDPTAD